ncbi:MAG: 2OG-Fe(II) oxygenase [Microcoleaceae cyanobacterium]
MNQAMEKIDNGIWYTGELLNPQECAALIAKAESVGFKVARMQDKGRNNKETFVKCPETMQTILLRLSEQVSDAPTTNFQVLRLGPILECYRYEVGEFVSAHCDAPREIEPGLRSKYTLVIYLSDEIKGGDTVFPNNQMRVCPTRGRAVLFDHVIRHEGAKVLQGMKYIVRTDVAVSGISSSDQSIRHKTSILG